MDQDTDSNRKGDRNGKCLVTVESRIFSELWITRPMFGAAF